MTAAIEEPQVDYAKVQALQNDPEIWDLERIARELDVTKTAVNKWRWKTLQHLSETGQDPEGEIPPPVPTAFDLLPLPDAPGSKHRRPKWYAGTIRAWAMQVGRMSPEGTTRHMPRRGRPKKSLKIERSAPSTE